MKKKVLILAIIGMAVSAQAQQNKRTNPIQEIVINHAMIEKFNKFEYSSTYTDFQTIMNCYNFSEVKLIVQAYRAGELELDTQKIDRYLASLDPKKNIEPAPTPEYSNKQLLSSFKR